MAWCYCLWPGGTLYGVVTLYMAQWYIWHMAWHGTFCGLVPLFMARGHFILSSDTFYGLVALYMAWCQGGNWNIATLSKEERSQSSKAIAVYHFEAIEFVVFFFFMLPIAIHTMCSPLRFCPSAGTWILNLKLQLITVQLGSLEILHEEKALHTDHKWSWWFNLENFLNCGHCCD